MTEPYVYLTAEVSRTIGSTTFKVGYTTDCHYTPYGFILRYGETYRGPLEKLLAMEAHTPDV